MNFINKQNLQFTFIHFRHTTYYLDTEFIPSFFPKSSPSTILFIGKAVSTIFESKQNSVLLSSDVIERHTQLILNQIQKDEFSCFEFEHVLRQIRSVVAQTLWRVIVIAENYESHLKVRFPFFYFFFLILDSINCIMRNVGTFFFPFFT